MRVITPLAIASALALALPGLALAAEDPAPKTSASAACKAERAQMGAATFKATYGTNKTRSNALGKCVSKRTRAEKANRAAAQRDCRAEQAADPAAFNTKYGTGKKSKNAFGKCVSSKSKAKRNADTKANVNAAKTCKAQRAADAAAFRAKWGSKRNAFGKCVSATAKAKPKPYTLQS